MAIGWMRSTFISVLSPGMTISVPSGRVTTPVTSASSNVNAATSANPIAITTSAAHGFTNGQTVTFAGMPGDFGTNLNGNNYVITYVNTTQFTVAVDGALYAAYTTGGTVTRVTTSNQSGGGAGAGVGGGRFDYTTAVP